MLRTLMNEEYQYLRRVAPHIRLHYGSLRYAILLGMSPLLGINEFVINTLLPAVLTVGILVVYWRIQFRIVRSGVLLSRYEIPLPDDQIGTITPEQFEQGKVLAVLWHHRYFILFISLALTGLVLVILLFLFYLRWIPNSNPDWRGIWQYVGVPSGSYPPAPYHYLSPLAIVQFSLFAPLILLALTLTNSILSASIGLWAGYVSRAWGVRFNLWFMLSLIYLGWQVSHKNLVAGEVIIGQLRLIESLQAVVLAFLDGGAGIVAGMFNPQSVSLLQLQGFQIRHFAILIVTITSQLALSGFLLHRRSRVKGKKEAGSSA